MMIDNPLLIDSPLEYGAPLFNEIREEHFLPAFQEAIRQAENEIDTIVENTDDPDFENTIAALDRAGRLVDRVAGIFYNINSACTCDGIKEIARKVSPMMTAYALYISLNEKLFEKVDKVYGDRDKLSLTPEQSMLLKKTHESFVRGGAALSLEDKKKYGELSEALDLAKLRFEKNLLDATNDYVLHVKEESRLKGLPSYVIEAAAEEAMGRGLDGWAFTLSHTSMGAFLRFADDRELRKEIWMASATKALGAEVCLVKGVYDDAYAKSVELKDKYGYTFIHPFDDVDVIAGQGTIGLEILDQLSDVDAIVVPVGGGGLISGVAFAVKSLRPDVKVYGVQAAGAPSMYNAIRDHKIETLENVSTIADGIAVKTPGEHTFEYVSKYVDGIVTVTEDEICSAILALIEKQKMIAEGAGAAPVAAVMAGKLPELDGKRVCCLVSGGNIDVTILSRVISRGLMMSGRQCTLTIELLDKPGQLVAVSQIIAKCGSRIKMHQLQRGRHNNSSSERRSTRNKVEPMFLVCSIRLINPSEIEPTDSATTHLHLTRVQHKRWRHHPAILLLHLPRRPCARTARQKDTRCRIHANR